MATLIPALGACVSRMTAGERRLAERLEQKLDDDYLLWYDVPMGPRSRCPTGTRRRHISKQARLPIASRRHVAAATRPPVGAAPLLDDSDVDAELPGIMRVTDLQQEQMVRSLGDRNDFAPEWLKLVTQMVDPTTNSLLVLYDDAQSIYERSRSKQFSFKSVGIQAQGRTMILKINYRNTRQILQTASLIVKDLLTADDKDDDGIPLLKPISCGRDGEAPIFIKLPTLDEEAYAIADQLVAAHKEGHVWGDMAILCSDWKTRDLCADALNQRKLPFNVRKCTGDYNPGVDTIQIMTMKVSKGLEFPVVALPGVGHMPGPGEDEKEGARVFYVAATRATQRLVIGVEGDGWFGKVFKGQRRGIAWQ